MLLNLVFVQESCLIFKAVNMAQLVKNDFLRSQLLFLYQALWRTFFFTKKVHFLNSEKE